MQPVTIADIGQFLQMVITAFQDPLFFVFCAAVGFAVMYHVKHLMVDGV